MAKNAAMDEATQDVVDYLARRMREEHPYLKTEVLNNLVAKTTVLMTSTVQSERSNMKAAKRRIGFFSLLAELRNTIYELTLDSSSPRTIKIDFIRFTPILTPALLRVSKRFGAETIPLFWRPTTLDIRASVGTDTDREAHAIHGSAVESCLKRLGKDQLGYVQELTIRASSFIYVHGAAQEKRIVEQLGLTSFGFNMEEIKVEFKSR